MLPDAKAILFENNLVSIYLSLVLIYVTLRSLLFSVTMIGFSGGKRQLLNNCLVRSVVPSKQVNSQLRV